MLINKQKSLLITIVMLIACVTSITICAQEKQSYLLATQSTGGPHHLIGVALATLSKVKLLPTEKIHLSVIDTSGPGENIKLLRKNEAQFAILQGLFGHYAATGTGPIQPDGPQENLRSIMMLWPNVEQFVVKNEHLKTTTIDDLIDMKGSTMALGKKGSSTIFSNKILLSGLGIDIEKDFELFYASYNASVDAIENGQVDGINIAAALPSRSMTKTYSSIGNKMTMLEVSDEQLKRLDDGKGVWTRYVINADSYPGQSEPIYTIAQTNFLAVRKDIAEQAVYNITKAIFENLSFLNAIHRATYTLSHDTALAGLPVPLHPGALKYYHEVGIEVPIKLIKINNQSVEKENQTK